MARERRVACKCYAAVTALARFQCGVACDLVFAAFPVTAKLCTADAADETEAFVLDADVALQTVVGAELGAALFTKVDC